MEQKIIYEMAGLYRENFRVTGFTFGKGKKSMCILGNTRGNEYQQLYICSQMVKKLKKLEEKGCIVPGHEILVIPSANPYSINISKRFWPTDNTDINRMFPGYSLGETTQRIADGIFQEIQDYTYGIQFTSFYMPGNFVPHVRMMKTNLEYTDKAAEFGLPYVVVRTARPYDTTTLNYNWQIWDAMAFSVYSATTDTIDEDSAEQVMDAMLNFMSKEGIITYKGYEGYRSRIISDDILVSVRPTCSGIFQSEVKPGQKVLKGQPLADILNPYTGVIDERIVSPSDGIIFFVHNHPLTYTHTAVFKLIPTASL